MSVGKKGLFRLAIIILAIPVVLLLVLHFFGRNEMRVEMKSEIDCDFSSETQVILNGEVSGNEGINQMSRVTRSLDRKNVQLKQISDSCLGDSTALHLVDRDNFLRGSYNLNQLDVNRLFVELDIIRQQDAYGREVSR